MNAAAGDRILLDELAASHWDFAPHQAMTVASKPPPHPTVREYLMLHGVTSRWTEAIPEDAQVLGVDGSVERDGGAPPHARTSKEGQGDEQPAFLDAVSCPGRGIWWRRSSGSCRAYEVIADRGLLAQPGWLAHAIEGGGGRLEVDQADGLRLHRSLRLATSTRQGPRFDSRRASCPLSCFAAGR